MTDLLSSLAYLCGKPTAKAKIKAKPEHFKVVEDLGYDFSGSGEQVMIRIRKTGENTSFVANELAKACGVKSKDVSWAGLKDRHAVTEQWLSVHMPQGKFPNLSLFLAQYPNIEVLAMQRHNKKLRPGDLRGNRFEVVLSEVTDVDDVLRRLAVVAQQGVPNYFGNQRFGRDGNNVTEARRWGARMSAVAIRISAACICRAPVRGSLTTLCQHVLRLIVSTVLSTAMWRWWAENKCW